MSVRGEVGAEEGRRPASRAAEDYLKAIYRLERPSSPVSTSDLADVLERAAPSVTNMIKGLATRGLVEHSPYHGVRLTPLGREAARRRSPSVITPSRRPSASCDVTGSSNPT